MWNFCDNRKSLDQTVAFLRALSPSGITLTPIRDRGSLDGLFGARAFQLPQKSDEHFNVGDKLRLVDVSKFQTFMFSAKFGAVQFLKKLKI